MPGAGHAGAAQADARIGVGRQLCLCLVFCAFAGALFALRPETRAVFTAGLAPAVQLLVGLGAGAALALNSLLSYRLARFSPGNARTIDGYDRLDLSGWNPLWFALAAGIGEELLFRGALQPLLGLWAATALFVAAHARAYRFRVDRTALAQIATLLAVGLLFGVVTRYVGLYAAIVAHVATDLAGLHVVRKAASRRILQTAA